MVYSLPDKYISLLTDFGFKRVFGTEPNKALLMDFLNTLLPPQHQIQDLTFKSNENLGQTPIDRKAIFDTLVHGVELKNQQCELFYPKLKFIYIELPKFTKSLEELETHLDKWLYLFRHLAEFDNPPSDLQEPVFAELFEVAEIANFSPAEQTGYQNSLKYYRDLNNIVDTARSESMAQGLKEGLQEGRRAARMEILERQRVLVLGLLDRTLGQIPETLRAQIDLLSLEALQELTAKLLDFRNVEDLAAWLSSSIEQ